MPKHYTKKSKQVSKKPVSVSTGSIVELIKKPVKEVNGSFKTTKSKNNEPLRSQSNNIMEVRKLASTSSKARKAKKNAI